MTARITQFLRRLARDDGGAVMVVGAFMAILGVGLLYHLAGVGETVLYQERLQDAADSGAFAANRDLHDDTSPALLVKLREGSDAGSALAEATPILAASEVERLVVQRAGGGMPRFTRDFGASVVSRGFETKPNVGRVAIYSGRIAAARVG